MQVEQATALVGDRQSVLACLFGKGGSRRFTHIEPTQDANLLSGFAAGLVHVITNADSRIPTIGASGAVAGIMGAYFRFFPHARVQTVIPPFFFGPVFVIPAVVFLGWWLLLQFFNGTVSLIAKPDEFGGVAWWAHVGGFVFGMLLVVFAPRKRAVERYDYEDR